MGLVAKALEEVAALVRKGLSEDVAERVVDGAISEEKGLQIMERRNNRQALRDEANRLRFGDPDTSYRGDHRAPDADYGAPLHDLTQMIPDDIYSSQGKRLYGLGRSDVDDEAFDVLNAVRGQPDAEVTMYRAVPEDAPDSILDGDWVTTSEEYARMHGENTLNNEYKILTEPTYARRLQSEGYPYEFGYMEKGSATPGGLAAAGSTALIASLLAEDSKAGVGGHIAKEVADLVRLGFPESTATKIASGELPMDTASRMQRAEEQGYSPDVVYRGIGRDYDPDKAGHYQMFTSSSQDAAEYGDNVIEARLNLGDSIEVDGRGRNFNNIYVGDLPSNLFDRLHGSERESLIARTDDLAHAANKAGNDSLIIKNIYDKADNEIPKRPSPNTDSRMPDIELLRGLGIEVDATPAKSGGSFVDTENYDPVDVSVVFDPSRVRSADAAFDPDYKGSNILGEYALPAGSTALMASLLAAPEEAEAGITAGSESNAVTEATSRIVNHMLDNVTEVTDLLEIPQRGIQGLLRAGYGLMQGDGLDASLNAGADVVNQGVEETAKQAGDAMLEKTGNPELAAMAYTAVMLGSPL